MPASTSLHNRSAPQAVPHWWFPSRHALLPSLPRYAGSAVTLVNVVVAGCPLPAPTAGAGTALRPRGLLPAAQGSSGGPALVLQDVRVVVDAATIKAHIAFFKQQQTKDVWTSLWLYTVGVGGWWGACLGGWGGRGVCSSLWERKPRCYTAHSTDAGAMSCCVCLACGLVMTPACWPLHV